MAQITPLVQVGFPSNEMLDVDLIIGLLAAGDSHVAYPNKVRAHQQRASGGHIALGAFEGETPWVILCDELDTQVASSLPSPRYPSGSGIYATIYLVGIDPEALSLASIFPITRSVGIFDKPQGPFTRRPDEIVRCVEFTHRFDVATPMLGKMTVFATKEKIVKRLRELKY